jgi:drug/metabolite transporter (DMT)-like permease
MVIGFLFLGNVPSLAQLAGFAVVMTGLYFVLLR